MNCTACKKPVDEHGEGRETDRCVAEKLGWTDVYISGDNPKDSYGHGAIPSGKLARNVLPYYSSKEGARVR